MDELETCIKREILSIHVKHRERKKETAEKISMTCLRNGIAKFKEEDKVRNGKIGRGDNRPAGTAGRRAPCWRPSSYHSGGLFEHCHVALR